MNTLLNADLRLRRLRLGVLFAVALAVTGSARAGLFDDDEARKQIAEQGRRITELQAQIQSQQKKQNDELNARLAKLEEAMKSQALLDLLAQIESLKDEMNKLRGTMEVLGNNIDTTVRRQKDMYTDLDSRIRRVEQPIVPAPPAAPATGAAPPPEAAPVAGVAGKPPVSAAPAANTASVAGATPASLPTSAPADVQAEIRSYESAQNLRRIGNYQGAIVAFQNFIKQYPKSGLASSAQYWVGDSYFNMRDFKMAISNQQQLLKTYPDSPKVPDAMLNIASSQAELGEGSNAKKTMEDIVAKYPVSDAADKAKRRLATLK